ncbi:hypothetical protein WJS89_10630 [Sphingomicrobium sp. XHP0235]|uniref:hypothetical protein n=1 Tax=Sphingomicrobium aquimarinum TaxID=3133971 RepID=UPI0031FE8496
MTLGGVLDGLGNVGDLTIAGTLIGLIVTVVLTSRKTTSESEKWLRDSMEVRIKSLEAQVEQLTRELHAMRQEGDRAREERDHALKERDEAILQRDVAQREAMQLRQSAERVGLQRSSDEERLSDNLHTAFDPKGSQDD